ncbi:kielin/chordin-like protein isoform X1 [Amphibalanus amphitrite]|uniref:kielin/chordin-like protein isoform X1 n=1 Tax=Amphibalanus amphitrite TaxID=1232801 RepID=UPI001C908F93|nr:kielin/chordin-like protein isoform X1 [Amphibalanus amphitrite]
MRTHLLLLTGLLAAAGAVSPPYRPPPLEPDPPRPIWPGRPPGPARPPGPIVDPPRPPAPRPPGEEPGCTPGLWIYDGCNTCRCTPERKIKCTSNVCREPPAASCQYGRTYLDQCDNVCFCDKFGAYQCRPRGTPGAGICYHDGVTGKPTRCEQEGFIRVEAHTHFFCQDGIVHFEYVEESGFRCQEGASWREECNTCSCMGGPAGASGGACTLIGCLSNAPPPPRPPRPAPLEFGDVVLPDYEPCPAGFVAAPGMLGVKICKAAGCTPGVEWNLSSCEKCVCTRTGEPACTPCIRTQSDSTVVCGERRPVLGLPVYQLCPADCGQRYDPRRDCIQCRCGVGKPGDVNVGFDEPCPPGFGHRSSGAFFRACGPIDDLPTGDFEDCSPDSDCPAHCEFVRRSQNGCIQCLCEGRELVPVANPCPPPKVEGIVRDGNKICKPATREECSGPGTEYQVGCDLCVCQEGGVPACTHRQCDTTPEEQSCQYGPVIVDECNTVCRCVRGGGRYACGRRGCPPGRTSGKPLTCPARLRELPRIRGLRVFCHEGIVKAQPKDERCIEGSRFLDDDYCNSCSCRGGGAMCTKLGCITPIPGPSYGDEANRPGQCPWMDENPAIRCIHYNKQCDDDRLCPPGHKCCGEICGQKCRPACAPACAPGQRCQPVEPLLERAECVPVNY